MSGSSFHQLRDLLLLDALTEVVDVGANPVGDEAPYRTLLAEGLCRVTGFEPQSQALAQLNANKSAHETYLPYAVGDGSPKTMYLCRHSGWSSMLTPSEASLDVFSAYKHNATVVGTVEIETKRLDDISEIKRIDYLKVDIQGGELDVFKHGRKKLSETVMLQTEVPFVNLYDAQPSLGDIDQELRAQGFIAHDILTLKRGIISPFLLDDDPWRTLNQILDADFVYVRDFRDSAALDDDQLRHLSLVAHALYRSYDLTYRCVLILEERGAIAPGSGQRYIDLVNRPLSPNSR